MQRWLEITAVLSFIGLGKSHILGNPRCIERIKMIHHELLFNDGKTPPLFGWNIRPEITVERR
ncbi:hypothetical protein D3C75_955890 [compost metagenome]